MWSASARLVRADLSAQRFDFPGDGPQGLLGRIGVDVVPVAASPAVALDAVGAENPVTSRDLQVFMDESAEAVTA
jgi:hypothetical protein